MPSAADLRRGAGECSEYLGATWTPARHPLDGRGRGAPRRRPRLRPRPARRQRHRGRGQSHSSPRAYMSIRSDGRRLRATF